LYFILRSKEERIIAIKDENAIIAGRTKSARIQTSLFGGTYIRFNVVVYVHDGKQLTQRPHSGYITQYSGERTLSECGLIVLDKTLIGDLIKRGKKYVDITSKPTYIQYNDVVVRQNYYNSVRYKATGRAMIDVTAMKNIDTNYSHYFAIDPYSNREETETHNTTILTDEMYMCMAPYVYGFSFVSKVWGEFNIDHISEVKFRDDAYDMLVMEEETKNMLFSLVETNNVTGKDFIEGKGGGCIFMLDGNPGVGKTLTAEAIAEKLQKPLYMVSVGELGTDVSSLEENLRNILEIASSWNAVLLIDEADIFMEERSDLNIERNAMVGVFLRLLEYYAGVLFLTTNRAKKIDKAFFSRISLAIHYEDLSESSRYTIWNNILSLYGIKGIDIKTLSKSSINGRQIKNCVRIAVSLAEKENRKVITEDLIKVTRKIENFARSANDTTPVRINNVSFKDKLSRLFRYSKK